MYQVQIVWNREVNYVNIEEPQKDLDKALTIAKMYKNMSDGEAVKKAQIIDMEGTVIVPSHQISY